MFHMDSHGRMVSSTEELASCRHPTSPQRASTFPEETQNSLYATVHVMPLRIYVNSVNSTTTTTATEYILYMYLYPYACQISRVSAGVRQAFWLGLRNGRSRLGFEWNSIDQTNIRRTHNWEYQSCPHVGRCTRGSDMIKFFVVFANRIMTLWYVGLCIR